MSTLEFSQLLGNYGEFVGAIAIVATLIYLAVQIRENTRLMQREAHLDRARHIAEPLIGSPRQLAETLHKINAKDGSIEPVTLTFMRNYELEYEEAVSVLRFLHRLWYTYEADYLFSGRSDYLDRIVSGLLSFEHLRLFWQYEKEWVFSPKFVAYVDSFADGGNLSQHGPFDSS